MFTSLLKNAKVTRIATDGAGAASATPTKGTIIDMASFDAVMFIAVMGNVLDTSQVALRVAGSDLNTSGSMALLAGSAGGTAGASDYDDKLVILDVEKPRFRYLEAQLFHVTANAPFDAILAIQYNAKSMPVTQGSTVVASASLAGPVAA
ncbi:hypothetical protein [Falsiroseomonas sp.]|uniref:hypothetical protein n=1 Tax=Falsiroseomonas sp. TaxID=2870721 RepID=UPI002732B2B7|nr:hypothetical protein [Falsiroseomonas sp.]MDP3417860.1 hypothetical protein [Falsiroseomonas sp.]